MDDKVKGLAILQQTILDNLRHPDYPRVTKLAKEYFDIFTGENVNDYLRQLVIREDDRMFEQRKKIYQTTIPATVENIIVVFNKPLRSNRIYSSVDHPDSRARDEIMDRIGRFWQGESESGVDAYLRNRWISLDVYDPNAYMAVEFGDFDPAQEKPYPFPYEYSSTQAINYQYKNGVLDWLIAQLAITYRIDAADETKTAAGSRYILYLDNWAISLTEIDKKARIMPEGLEGAQIIEVRDRKDKLHSVYALVEYNTKAGKVPLVRAGHKLDPVTQNRTCVSILHPALTFFKKELKTGSEFDLTMAMHAFPQKIQYGKRCSGDKDKGIQCKDGRNPISNEACSICSGTGVVPVATSTQDVLLIAPPKHKDDPVLDLDKAVVYKSPDISLVKFQDEFQDKLSEKAIRAVFASQVMGKSTIEKTATETDYGWDNVYDTLDPFAAKYSYIWRFFVGLIATYTDNQSPELVIYHAFPKDFKLKGLTTLLQEAKTASESGLSQHAIDAINGDILEALYSDDQDTLTRLKIKSRFHPFSGKTAAELQTILMTGEVLPYYKTLYLYFDVIFDEIDNEEGDRFYLMTYANQKAIVKGKVDAILAQVAAGQANAFNAVPETAGGEGDETA